MLPPRNKRRRAAGNIVPPHFDGILLRPDPPVRRPLSVYTRVRPDPITAAFVAAIAVETLVTPPHIASRLGLAPAVARTPLGPYRRRGTWLPWRSERAASHEGDRRGIER
jgi:hypothetical protein